MGTITNSNIFNGVAVAGNKITGMAKGGNIFYRHDGSYAPFATPILDLDFQNNFIDKSPSALNMVQGQGLPTFELSGRKVDEYCANFNGSQSIKTTTNLPLNSDKVCVKFWIKTTQASVGIIYEMSPNFNYANAFISYVDGIIINADSIVQSYNVVSSQIAINDNSWKHVICIIDRSFGVNQNKIYVNGVLSFVQNTGLYSNNNGNFVNNIFYIGQRAGTSLGFNGSLAKYQVFNQVPTDAQAMEMYLNDL